MNVQNVHSGGASLSDSAIEHRCSLPKKAMHLAKTCFRSGLRAFRSLEAMQPAVRSAVRWEWFLPSPVLQVVCPTIQSAYPEWVILLFPDWAVGIHPEGLPCRKLPRPDFIHRNVGMPVCLSIHSQPESFSPSILSSSPQHLFSASLWQQRARSTFNALSQQRRQILALLLSLSLCLFFFFSICRQAGKRDAGRDCSALAAAVQEACEWLPLPCHELFWTFYMNGCFFAALMSWASSRRLLFNGAGRSDITIYGRILAKSWWRFSEIESRCYVFERDV